MRATEFIRDILDLIDKIECNSPEQEDSTDVQSDADRATAQIADLVSSPDTVYTSAPNVKYTDITAVTTGAGGGVNGPKHPADLRGNSFSIYR